MVTRIGALLAIATLGVVGLRAPGASAATDPSGALGVDVAAAVRPAAPSDADQVLVVSAAAQGTSRAMLTGYGWVDGRWVVEIGPVTANLGGNGFTVTPHEADGFTPAGEYSVTTIFGAAADPGTSFAYRRATSDDHWVDDPTSAVYNTWQIGPSGGRWRSAETLSGYEYAIAFDFNQQPVVPDANSAIFLHEGGGATPGCIVVGRSTLVDIMRWLDPAARPRIVLGVDATLPAHLAPPTLTTRSPALDAAGDAVAAAGLRHWFAGHPEWSAFA